MAELTREQARRIVDEAGQKAGYITEEDRAATPPSVLKALQNVRNRVAGELLSYVELWNPSVGIDILYQLISNSRSLRYHWARRQGKDPFFSLDVSQYCVVIDTNDDGFQETDMRALSEGMTIYSKDSLYGAVLVSMAHFSKEVHIQSGPFSFTIGTRGPDDKLGFITPVNKDPSPLPQEVRTRISLYPAQPHGFAKLADGLRAIAHYGIVLLDAEVAGQPVCNKFVFIARPKDLPTTRITYELHLRDDKTSVTKTNSGLLGFSLLPSEEHFLLYRPTSPSDLHKTALLFPIDQNSRPVLWPRKIHRIVGSFAYPISSNYNLKFIVCANVSWLDNRNEANIHTSKKIHNCIVNLFCDAVAFCQRHSLTYSWVQYVPTQLLSSTAQFDTVQDLIEKLRVAPLFQSHKGSLKPLSSLRYLSPEHYGTGSKPLFGDLDDEHYLSIKYSAYLDLLRPIGLQEISDNEVLAKLKPVLTGHLRLQPVSKLAKEPLSSILRLLILWLKRDPNGALASEIRALPLILLSNGTFTRGINLNLDQAFGSDAVYFSTDTNGNKIPRCLAISTVAETISDNNQKELFSLLGVRHARPEFVMEHINNYSHRPFISFEPIAKELMGNFKQVLCYVYDSCAKDDRLSRPCLRVFDEYDVGIQICAPSCGGMFSIHDEVYLKTDGAYGTIAIAKRLNSEDGSMFGQRLRLLHPSFLQSTVTQDTHTTDHMWISWLEQQQIVMRVPSLTRPRSGGGISGIFCAIIDHHPDLLLGVLERHWDTYRKEINENPLLKVTIKTAKVPTSNGSARLDECYFPIPEACEMARAVSTPLSINFLGLPGGWGTGSEQKWGFLRDFGVSGDRTVMFMKAIKHCLLSNRTLQDARPHFFEMYRWVASSKSDILWPTFDGELAVYIPSSSIGARLVSLNKCVWHGPPWLQTVYPLEGYEEYTSDSKIRNLFWNKLALPDADWKTYMAELIHLQSVGVGSISQTQRIYQAVMDHVESEEDWMTVRDQFKLHNMVYVPGSRDWYAPQECIWASLSIGDREGISEIYREMESFFVEKLQVQRPSMSCCISHIERLCKDLGGISGVIEILHIVNSLEPTKSGLDQLRNISFLPIDGIGGKFYWGSAASDFFIIDQDGWPMQFYEKVPTLDLSLEEIHDLARLLTALGLEDRFISVCATKKTKVLELPSQSSLYLTSEFRQRSSGLSRCIVHYLGGNLTFARQLYDTFRKASVYETEHIVGECTLTSQTGSRTSVETCSRLHMEYFHGKLSIFVPLAQNERLICYATDLPQSLVTSLKIEDPKAIGLFATILQVPAEIIDDILKAHGIPELPGLETVSPVEIDDSESEYEDALEHIFVPSTSICWGSRDQMLSSEQSELQLVIRSKETEVEIYHSLGLGTPHLPDDQKHEDGLKVK